MQHLGRVALLHLKRVSAVVNLGIMWLAKDHGQAQHCWMSNYARKVVADFFKVNGDNGIKLGYLIQQASQKTIEERTIDLRDGLTIRLESISCGKNGHFEGQMIRIQDRIVPGKASRKEKLQPLGLSRGMGLAPSTSFLFDSRRNFLLIEKNRSAVSASSFAAYWRQLFQLDGPIHLDPMIRPDMLAEVLRAKRVKRLQIQIAGPDVGALMHEHNPSVDGILKARHALRANVVEVTFSVGRERAASLDVKEALGAAKEILGFGRNEEFFAEKLRISGNVGDDEKFNIDLLEHQIRDEEKLDTGGPHIEYETVQAALQRIWVRKQPELNIFLAKN